MSDELKLETDKLLPCPFCGDYASMEKGDNKKYYVCCNPDTGGCFTKIGWRQAYDHGGIDDYGDYETPQEAAAAWNTRSEPYKLAIAVEALKYYAEQTHYEAYDESDRTVTDIYDEDCRGNRARNALEAIGRVG